MVLRFERAHAVSKQSRRPPGCALRSSAYLRFVECFLIDFLVECLRDSGALQNAVLTEEQPVLKSEFSEGKANDQLLPREERPV